MGAETIKTWIDGEQYSHGSKLSSHSLLASHREKKWNLTVEVSSDEYEHHY